MKIGFIGLGIMGSRMAANLLKHQHSLVLYNRSKKKADELLSAGAVWAESPAAVAREVDILITMLAHPEAVREVATGEQGLFSGMRTGSLWIDCSTVHPSFAREMATAAISQDIRFIDAPVAGSKNQAAGAQLVFFAGGQAADIEAAAPLFNAMGQKTVHVGDHGMGTSLKMVVNLLLATSMAAFSEGIALGESLGLSREMLLNALIGGPVTPPYLAMKKDNLLNETYPVEFPLQWMQKDLQMAAIAGYESGAAMPLVNITKEIYRMAMQDGFGADDFSAVFGFMKK